MTTRLREDYDHWKRALVSVRSVRNKDRYTVITPYTSNRQVLGAAKQTVDVPEVRLRRNRRSFSLGVDQRYQEPYLRNHVPVPHSFKVRHVVGPENSYGELQLTHLYPAANPNSASLLWTGDLVSHVMEATIHGWALPPSFPTLDSKITDYTHVKAHGNVRAAQVDVGVSLGELVETAKFLASPVNSIVKLCQNFGVASGKFNRVLRNGKYYWQFFSHGMIPPRLRRAQHKATKVLKCGTRVIDEGSNFWLGFRFGVTPMLSDIDNYVKLHQEGLEAESPGVRHGRSKFELPNTTAMEHRSAGYTLGCQCLVRKSVQTTYRTDVQFIQKYDNLALQLDVLGLNPLQLPNVMWELVPLSFVLDRFIGIGDWIASKRPRPGTEILGATHSLKEKARLVLVPQSLYSLSVNSAFYHTKWYSEPQEWYRESYVRQIAGAMPVLPVWNPRLLDIKQWVDHLLLTWQRMPKFSMEKFDVRKKR